MDRLDRSGTKGTGSTARGHSGSKVSDDTPLPGGLSRFIGGALGAGDIGLVIDFESRRARLEQQLVARGFDVALAIQQGRFVSVDAGELLAKLRTDGMIDHARFMDIVGNLICWSTNRAKDAPTCIAIFDGMVESLRASGDAPAAAQLEQLWRQIAQQHPVRVRTGVLSNPDSVLERHDSVVRSESGIDVIQVDATQPVDKEYGRMKRELEDKDQKLVKAEAARDEFLTVAAHELKTPISVLLGFTQLLLRDSRRGREIPTERLESSIAAVELQGRKLKKLISRLFETIQIGESRLQLDMEHADFAAVVRAAVAAPRGDMTHTIVFNGPKSLAALIDPIRMEHALINLIDNAIKFSPEGGTIRLRLLVAENGDIQLTITDDGMGIPTDQRSDVFDRFYQAHGEPYLSGLGLGLYISREIIDLHGGSIHVEQPDDRGTRILVTLPSLREGAADERYPDASAHPTPVEP